MSGKRKIYTVYIASTLRIRVRAFVGVGRYVSVTRKITESILFSEISQKLNVCANSVYQAFPPPLERLGTRLDITLHVCSVDRMVWNDLIFIYNYVPRILPICAFSKLRCALLKRSIYLRNMEILAQFALLRNRKRWV